MELRKATITKTTVEHNSLNPRLNPGLNRATTIERTMFFHKWFDGLSQDLKEPIQYAIVEFEDGSVSQIDINIWKIKFEQEN